MTDAVIRFNRARYLGLPEETKKELKRYAQTNGIGWLPGDTQVTVFYDADDPRSSKAVEHFKEMLGQGRGITKVDGQTQTDPQNSFNYSPKKKNGRPTYLENRGGRLVRV